MNRIDFGKLITSLRKEHSDEDGRPWSQAEFAREANLALGAELFSENVIGKIERGKRNLDQETLLALAKALRLTSGERKEFFLAASGIDDEKIARQENDPEEVASQLIERIKQTYAPAYVVDSYYDTVALNYSLLEFLEWIPHILEGDPTEGQPFPLNALAFIFSDWAVKYLGEHMGEDWAYHAFQTVTFFRTISLRYRATEYFQHLLQGLWMYPLFRRYWWEVYYDEKDQFVDNRYIQFNSPKYGRLVSYSASVTALTTAGELHLCAFLPATYETAEVFSKISHKSDARSVFRLASWPAKDLSGMSRLCPVD